VLVVCTLITLHTDRGRIDLNPRGAGIEPNETALPHGKAARGACTRTVAGSI
jgi:hypothetical protein